MNLESLKLLCARKEVFKDRVLEDCDALSERLFRLLGHSNREIKETASETFEEITSFVADAIVLHAGNQRYKKAFDFLIEKFQKVLDDPNDMFLLTVCIRASTTDSL
jgi:hypothetical protein